jgi:SAM-dependent methyltransferase
MKNAIAEATAPVRLAGFDAAAEVISYDGRLLRGVYAGHGAICRQVLGLCESRNLFQYGIVPTRELPVSPFPELPFELVLEHERIEPVSYPHEWSASMLKDAALLHLDLCLALAECGLTIKDWHPYNVLFRGTEPVFVDFTSIIPAEQLGREPYLSNRRAPPLFGSLWDDAAKCVYDMYRRMYRPYFLTPLEMMRRRRHAQARKRLLETTLNAAGQSMHPDEVGANRVVRRAREIGNCLALLEHDRHKRRFFWKLRRQLERLPVAPPPSAYSRYYELKGEDSPFQPSPDWTEKQQAVHELLQRHRPETVLDAASNTGWFSVLAAKLGSRVVALDIDEACVDTLYQHARQEKLPILPLVMDLTRLPGAVEAQEFPEEPKRPLVTHTLPLLLPAEDRLACDLVLALALVHHLALGQAQSLCEIVDTLASLGRRYLLVEFVARDDKLIVDEPSFFAAYNARPREFDWYTRERFVEALRARFRHVESLRCIAATRSLLLCQK